MNDLPGVFGTVAPYIRDYGYLAVLVLVLIENLGIPMPGEATLITAGLYTTSGDLDLVVVLMVGFAAAVVGDNLAFALGRYGGRPLALRLGRRFGVSHELLDRVEHFYARHGSKTVAVGRFLPLLRHLNGLAAGLTTMTWRRFLVANAVGAAVWVGVWTTVGIQAGNHIDAVNTGLEKSTRYLVVLLVLLVLGLVWRRRAHRRRPAADPDPDHESTEEHR